MSLMEAKYPQHPGIMVPSKHGLLGARCSKKWATPSCSRTSPLTVAVRWCALSHFCLVSTKARDHLMPCISGALKSQPLGKSGVCLTRCGCWHDRMERLERKQEKLLATKLRLYNVCIHREATNYYSDKPCRCLPSCEQGTTDNL